MIGNPKYFNRRGFSLHMHVYTHSDMRSLSVSVIFVVENQSNNSKCD